jgi:hypothetical protein
LERAYTDVREPRDSASHAEHDTSGSGRVVWSSHLRRYDKERLTRVDQRAGSSR